MARAARIVILSDTHFGAPSKSAGQAGDFSPLLRDGDHLIINGDVLELRPKRFTRTAWDIYGQLSELCESRGVTLTCIAGNHDPLREWPLAVEIGDGEILATHGHGFHPAIAPWCRNASYLRNALAEARHTAARAGMPDNIETFLACSLMACESEPDDAEPVNHRNRILSLMFRPGTIASLLAYWRAIPGLASVFGTHYAPKSRFIVFGHTHHQGIWQINHHTIINTGNYAIPGKPWAVVIEGQSLKVHPLVRKPDGYRLSEQPQATYELKSNHPAESIRFIYGAFPPGHEHHPGREVLMSRAASTVT